MYVLLWRTVYALTRVLFWCLFPSLLRNSGNKHQNNPLVSAQTVRHASTYIILYVPQESRKIIAAMIQHIIYKEQLPMLMGDQIMKDFDLALADEGYYYGKIDRVCCLILFRNYFANLILYQ